MESGLVQIPASTPFMYSLASTGTFDNDLYIEKRVETQAVVKVRLL